MKNKVSLVWKIILPILRNKFLVSIIVFIAWIMIFDNFSLIDRYYKLIRLNELKKEHTFYKMELEKYKIQYEELSSGKRELEKFAREQYLMRAPNEKVFIVNVE